MSTEADTTMKVLYVRSASVDVDEATLPQLRTQAPELSVTVVVNASAALAEIRATAGWQAVLVSPALPQNETLALIASLRRDRVPIAIVPIVDDTHQDVFASAVASGADDVLMRRNQALVHVTETLTRIRQSPHLFPAEQRRRLTVLYAGRDPLVWNLLEQVPFVDAARANVGVDGSCPVRSPGVTDGSLRCHAVVIDEHPGEAHPLQVLKSVKAQASDLPVIVLTSTGAGDVATAALELGADDTVVKTGIFRRRLVATLRRVHLRLELTTQQTEIKAREERLRLIVETVPTGITVIAGDATILAMNAAALRIFGAAKPRDLVGRDVRQFVAADHHDAVLDFVRRVTKGETTSIACTVIALDGRTSNVVLHGVMLERDARGGRGVVASISLESGGLTLGGVSTTGELADLREAIPRLEQHLSDLAQAHERELAEWKAERAAFEGRLSDADRAALEQQDRGERLAAMAAELGALRESHATERAQLDARLRELEDAAHLAGAAHEARTAAEDELQALRTRLADLVSAGEAAHTEWQAERANLEARLSESERERAAHADHAATLPSVRAEVDEARATLEAERGNTAARLAQLENELRLAHESRWTEHREREEARAHFEAELKSVRDALSAERADWEHQRAAHAAEREAQESRARGALDSEREEWRTTRDAWARDAQAIQDRSAGLEAELGQVRSQLDEARHQSGASEHERHAWAQERADLESRLRASEEAAAHFRHEHDRYSHDARTRIEQAAQHAAASALEMEALRHRLTEVQQQHEQVLEQHQVAHTDTRRQLESHIAALTDQVQHATDRAASIAGELETTRQDLHGHQQQAEQARQALQAELQSAREMAEAAGGDRAGRIEELERLLNDASARRAHLEHELDAIRATLAEAHAAGARHETERQEWDAARTRLEGDVEAARASHDAGRQIWDSLRAGFEEDLHRTREQLAAGQNDWEADRTALDSQRQQALERVEAAEREREALRAELADTHRQAADGRAAAESRWHDERAALESARRQADERLAQLEQERQKTQSDLSGQLDSERQAWSDVRAQLEAERDTGLEQLRSKQQEWDVQRTSFEGLLRHAHNDVESLQRELDATQAQLERDREDAKRSAERERGEWEAAGAAAEAEINALRAAASSLEHDLGTRVSELASALQAAEARAAETETIRAALDAARLEIRHTDEQHAAERAEWQAARAALDAAQADLTRHVEAEREDWSRQRAEIEAQHEEVAGVRSRHQQLEDSLHALRTDYAAMVQALALEREGRAADRRDLEILRAAAAANDADRDHLRHELEETARRAEARAAEREADHTARLRALDEELTSSAERLAHATEDAERARASLQTEYQRASESHTRLVASDMFAYAVTTLPGELVRCNDAFAQLLGFTDAPDALTRTAGLLLPGLSGRDQLMARLAASGRIDRVESCLERVDGLAVRIVESATLLSDAEQPDDEPLVEHVIIGTVASPDRDQLRARQLEEIGALTSAMVPEIETLVSTAHERGHDLRRQLRDGQGGADIEGMLALTASINALVRQLATFTRRHLREADSIDLAEAITRTEPVLVRLVGDFITFSMHLVPAPPVIVDAEDLDQLLTSVVTFGRDLLPAGGSLSVQVLPPASSAHPGQPAAASGSTLLTVIASGYGVQLPPDAPAVELVARRCGATLELSGEPGWMARLDIRFPRCGRPRRSGWTWSIED